MHGISELGQRILAELDEFEADDLFVLINTVTEQTGTTRELDEFLAATKELVERGYVVLGEQDPSYANQEFLDRQDSLTFAEKLGERFAFFPQFPRWDLKGGDFRTSRYPAIAVEKAGLELAETILDERGYRWWRPEGRKG